MIYLYVLSGFIIFFLLMALGVIFRRKPLRGTCGGLRAFDDRQSPCEVCGAAPEDQANCLQRSGR